MTTTAPRTTQLRRYALRDGVMAEFVAWWHENLVPARLDSGFAIEFAYAIHESNEFVWAVSAPGDSDAFAAVEAAYLASDARAAAFAGVDVPWTTSQTISLVDVRA